MVAAAEVRAGYHITLKEQTAMTLVIRRVHDHLSAQFTPQGYNLILNSGPDAGEGPAQVHVHVIPRA